MSFAFNAYPADLAAQNPYYEDIPQLTEFKLEIGPEQLLHDEPSPNLMRSFQQPRLYSAEPTFVPPYSLPNQPCVADEYPGVMWGYVSEQELYPPQDLHAFSPLDLGFTPETFSVGGQPAHYSNDHTYTRMFRGRKSKSAAEVSSATLAIIDHFIHPLSFRSTSSVPMPAIYAKLHLHDVSGNNPPRLVLPPLNAFNTSTRP